VSFMVFLCLVWNLQSAESIKDIATRLAC